MYKEQVHSLKAGSSKPKWVKHRRQMEEQYGALSGQIKNSHLPMLDFPLDSHEIP